MAAERGAAVVPVWNKSNREHLIVGSEPASVRAAADAAVRELGWTRPYHVDADHINLDDRRPLPRRQRLLHPRRRLRHRQARHGRRHRRVSGAPSRADRRHRDPRHRRAVRHHARVRSPRSPASTSSRCRRPAASTATSRRGAMPRSFVTEVSMDETDAPQTPPQLLVILAAIADEKIPVQTIAPKFTGRFNKGVDYVGDVAQFEKEFSRGSRGDRARRQPVRPAGEPEAERAFGQRQVLDLRRRSAARWRRAAPACTSRRRAPRGSRS